MRTENGNQLPEARKAASDPIILASILVTGGQTCSAVHPAPKQPLHNVCIRGADKSYVCIRLPTSTNLLSPRARWPLDTLRDVLGFRQPTKWIQTARTKEGILDHFIPPQGFRQSSSTAMQLFVRRVPGSLLIMVRWGQRLSVPINCNYTTCLE